MTLLSSRLQAVPPYGFIAIARKVQALRSRGVDVIRLDIGAPDGPPPSFVIAAMQEAVADPSMHGYPGYRGTPELKEAFAAYYEERFGVQLDPDTEVLPLLGSKEGTHHAGLAFISPGDVALVPDPSYPTYASGTLLAGGEVYRMPLRPENDFLPDLESIPVAVREKAKVLWVNYPNNPTGAVGSLAFFEQVVAFARRWGLLVCHDAPYCDVTFDGYVAPSMLQVPGAKEVVLEFNSLSKSHNMAGWRVGVAVGNKQAVAALLQVKSNVDSGIFLPIQRAATVALRGDRGWMQARNAEYAQRRDMMLRAVQDLGLHAHRPKATLYVWVQVPDGYTSQEFADIVLEQTGVSITPGSMYGQTGEGFVRMSVGAPTDRVAEAMARLRSVTW